MPFADTWMDLETIMLNDISQTERKMCDITYMQNLKRNDTNEFVYKMERDSQTSRMKILILGGRVSGKVQLGSLGLTYTHWYIS